MFVFISTDKCFLFIQIYQLVKLDCYPRFKKWQVIKDCLRAEMEGQPLPSPVQMTTSTSPSQATRPAVSTKPTNGTTNTTWPKKKVNSNSANND